MAAQRSTRATRLGVEGTERALAEARLRQALAEKEIALTEQETLLREVRHRLKNHLQILCDLLLLQLETPPPGGTRAALEDAYGRIVAVARLNELLYEPFPGGRVQVNEYLGGLVAALAHLGGGVTIALEAPEPVSLGVDRALHLGLIVSELVTNALQHAFGAGCRGRVVVGVCARNGQVALQVRDNGKGLPAGFALDRGETLGLRIVALLARRLQATVQVEGRAGACFTLAFPLSAE